VAAAGVIVRKSKYGKLATSENWYEAREQFTHYSGSEMQIGKFLDTEDLVTASFENVYISIQHSLKENSWRAFIVSFPDSKVLCSIQTYGLRCSASSAAMKMSRSMNVVVSLLMGRSVRQYLRNEE
jgi:hypothetical protein